MMKEFYPSLLEWIEHAKETADPAFVQKCFQALENVVEWAEPVKRGKRVFDDKEFIDSLSGQFKAKGALSERQVAALKRTASKYAGQIPNYADLQKQHELPAPRVPKPKAADAAE